MIIVEVFITFASLSNVMDTHRQLVIYKAIYLTAVYLLGWGVKPRLYNSRNSLLLNIPTAAMFIILY